MNFVDFSFFFVDVAVVLLIREPSWNKAECDLIDKVRVHFLTRFKKHPECIQIYDVLKQKFAHDVLLDHHRDRVEILLTLGEHRSSIIFPKVSEVGFDSILQIVWNVLVAAQRLIFYFFDLSEPVL